MNRRKWMFSLVLVPFLALTVLAGERSPTTTELVRAEEDVGDELTEAEWATHLKFAGLAPTLYQPTETLAEFFDRLGIASGDLYRHEFEGDYALTLFTLTLWSDGGLSVMVAEEDRSHFSYSSERAVESSGMFWSSPDEYFRGWVTSRGDQLALQVTIGDLTRRLLLGKEAPPDDGSKVVGPIFSLDAACGTNGCGAGGKPQATCKCRKYTVVACSDAECDHSDECGPAPRGTCYYHSTGF